MSKQISGQLSIFDVNPVVNGPYYEENKGLGTDCEQCECQWCSIRCFRKRGYVWDPFHRFMKHSDGTRFRKNIDNRECKKEY